MVKFPEAEARLFHQVFVCRGCKHKIRSPNMKVIQGKVKCRNCSGKSLRPVRRK